MTIRPAAVAGLFYPRDPRELRVSVQEFLRLAQPRAFVPKVLIVPHAGYVYSGQAAAQAYVLLRGLENKIKRVLLLGPCHRVPVHGVALPTVDAFATPLGTVPLDKAAIAQIEKLPFVGYSDAAHAEEHSLEVHLPFLQSVLGDFSLVPLVVGEASPRQVAQVLEQLWGGDETLVVISSDLSHFLPYAICREVDNETARKIVQLHTDLHGEEACGCRPLNGLLQLARQKHLHCELLALCNSGDTAGDKRRVVGYGAFALRPV
jgi:AmmeMemoRadiSam system protein B